MEDNELEITEEDNDKEKVTEEEPEKEKAAEEISADPEDTGAADGAAEPADGDDSPDSGSDKEPDNSSQESKESSSDPDEKKKKGFFNKKKDPKDTEIEELTDKLKRQMAEFDNYRKRTDKEKASMYEYGARDVIEKILPIVDNFERGLATIPEDEKGGAFAEGMEKIYKQLTKTLDDLGVKPIEAVGKKFDPAYHNAVMHVEDENLGENVVAQELQKGYMYKDTVIRHSMVQVAN